MERLGHHTTLLIVSLLFFGSSALDDGRSGRCPPLMKWNVCPSDAAPCDSSLDCGADSLCCESPCGGVCTTPLYTGCEHIQMAETRRARALQSEGISVRIPRCTKDGDFDSIQCDNEIIGSCWCVDESGFELPGTRAPARGLVNCTAPAACAAATCRMLCPHGFALGPDGCPQCRCRDPCQGIRCPGSLTCQLEEVACLKQPCPPVPTCKRGRSLSNVCPVGDPLMISDTHRPFLCGTDPGKPTCPPLYQCLVQRGNDYGVCCPASLKIQKPGMCPSSSRNSTIAQECDVPCTHDLECPSMQKCCRSDECGMHCVFPENLTECLQQKSLAEALSINEREGRGYIPQCAENGGGFEQRQCSRNGLVCWCVDSQGIKAKGSMGPAENVDCSKFQLDKVRAESRSLTNKLCDRNICASICEYGFRVDSDGCPTCECDDPCQGYPCQKGEECVPVKEQTCQEEFCPTYPICRPKISYVNPCLHETPLTNETTGEVINCDPDKDEDSDSDCPTSHRCVQVASSTRAVCCPAEAMGEEEDESEDYSSKPGLCPFSINHLCKLNNTRSCVADSECDGDMKCCLTSNCGSVCAHSEMREEPDDLELSSDDKSPSMCEYLRDFNEKMEGTHDGMRIALQTPECHLNGSFVATQCADGHCWCVDSFGTEVPKTRAAGKASVDCVLLRETSECLELTCRLGCDYGFVISSETQCPLCQCRNPCQDVKCSSNQECQMVDVACDNDYCPPVPACLPKKLGSCPYLVPTEGSCEYQCQSDAQCAGEMRCCSNGCGTQCVEPVVKTACQHQKAIILHKAAEAGIPGRQLYVPACKEDGSYEHVQCHEANNVCWCVDQSGRELPGTRKSGGRKPQCDAPTACPLIECDKDCEHGYMLDARGCSLCQCRDPCDDMKCLNEGEVCKVVQVQCITEPCPPVALCIGTPVNDVGLNACGVDMNGVPPQRCGPNEPPCPSTHKCHLSPLATSGSPAVCCPKPRSICFEPKDEGLCVKGSSSSMGYNSTTRWHFSPDRNQCVQFHYEGCSGNHNNFQSENDCKTVCPVLSQCERLREKNQKAAIRYKKDTFIPKCRSDTGEWEPVQCMEHIGVCWCANAKGEPLKGSLVRGTEPQCNFRQARRRMDSVATSTDEVLEELVRQMTAYNFIDSMEEFDTKSREGKSMKPALKSRCLSAKQRLAGSSAAYDVSCDSSGRYSPTQCESSERDAKCWCVDEAGNQLPGTSTFTRGDNICLPTPIEAVDISLGFFGEYSTDISNKMRSQLIRDLKHLGATIKDNEIEILNEPGVTYIHFTVIGNNKVDIAYHLEEMVKQEELVLHNDLIKKRVTMVADIRKSTFQHKIGSKEIKNIAENKIIALQHREILSESTVSMVTSYHTAIIVLAAASAFVISIMGVVLMLYRKKVASLGKNDTNKVATFSDRFLPSEPPVYVLSRPEIDGVCHLNERNDKEKL